jgi:hypothetical protein
VREPTRQSTLAGHVRLGRICSFLNFTVVVHYIDGARLCNGTLYFFLQPYSKRCLANASERIILPFQTMYLY